MQQAVAEAEAENLDSNETLIACKRALQMDVLSFNKYGIERAKQNYDTLLHVRRTFDLLRYLLQPGEVSVWVLTLLVLPLHLKTLVSISLEQWLCAKNSVRQREAVSSQVEQRLGWCRSVHIERRINCCCSIPEKELRVRGLSTIA